MAGSQAVILAGGKGSRFKPYTDIIPKPMMPVGEDEKPILEYIIMWLARYDIRDIVMLLGYRGKQIQNYFRDGSYWGVRLDYSWDDEDYSNTGGALLKAYKSGLINKGTLLVWYGDILAPLDVRGLLREHQKTGAHATLALADRYQLPVGVAEVENGRVIKLVEKPWYPIKASIGILALEASILESVEPVLGRSFDIMGNMMPWMINKGYNVRAFIHSGPWYDVGSMEKYAKLDNNLLREMFGSG